MNMDQISKNKNGIEILTSACIVHYFEKSNMNMYRFRLICNSEWHLACDWKQLKLMGILISDLRMKNDERGDEKMKKRE
jgi:hypothetical protein